MACRSKRNYPRDTAIEICAIDRRILLNHPDYYYEDGMLVFTAEYLKNRGYCCRSGCRHCPYGYKAEEESPPKQEDI